MTEYVTPAQSTNRNEHQSNNKNNQVISPNVVLNRLNKLLQRSIELHKRYQYRLQLQSKLSDAINQRNTVINEYQQKQQYIQSIHQYQQFIDEHTQKLTDRSDAIDVVNNELLASRKYILNKNVTQLNNIIKPTLNNTIQTINDKQQELIELKQQVKLTQQKKCLTLATEIYTLQPSKLLKNNIIYTTGIYCIRQYKLPINELHTYQARHVDTALYYTAHMTLLLSNYLNIALIYPITLHGSTSVVIDTSKSTAKLSVLPLHITNTNDIQQFETACVLLFKNIQHICHTHMTNDLWTELQQTTSNTSLSMLHYLFMLMRHILVTS